MSIMSTGSFPQDLRPGIRMWFGAAYKNYDTKYDKILDVKIPEDRAYEEDVMMSNLGLALVKPQGASVQYDNGQQMYSTRYDHIQYGLGFIITQEMMDDGIALKSAKIFSESLKDSLLRTREIIAANVYNNAFNTAIQMDGGDNQCLGSNAHPTPAGNFSNVPVTAASLSEASLEQAHIDVQNYLDNRGQRIMVQADRLIIGIPLQFTATRILKNVNRPATADRDINAQVEMGLLKGGIVVDPFLTSTTNWHLKTDQSGLNLFNRKDISLSEDGEFDTENMKTKGLMRLSVGWSDPRAGYFVNA